MDVDQFIEVLKKHEPFEEEDFSRIIQMAEEIFYQESTLLSLTSPITVCGDIHGQFYDLLSIFDEVVAGSPDNTKFLFLGDYVDRGYYSIETIALLICYKIKYPDTFYLLRGNHECRSINLMYGFYEETLQRFGHSGPYEMCNELFDYLPIAAVIDNKLFCVHGGLSPEIRALEQIAIFNRRKELPPSEPVSQLLWSDPEDKAQGWNLSARGAGFLFGPEPVEQFLRNNKLEYMARAHQLVMEGYQWHHNRRQCVTVWSAPNYMYRSNNLASVMKVTPNGIPEFVIFNAVPKEKRIIPPETGLSPYFT